MLNNVLKNYLLAETSQGKPVLICINEISHIVETEGRKKQTNELVKFCRIHMKNNEEQFFFMYGMAQVIDTLKALTS